MINIKWVCLATMEASQFDMYEIYLVDACKGFLHLYLPLEKVHIGTVHTFFALSIWNINDIWNISMSMFYSV